MMHSPRGDDGSLSAYLRQIDRVPLLTAEEERALAVRARAGDQTARDHLVNANLRFVVKVAKRYRGMRLSLTDLISEGNIGLLEAVDRFDPDRGNRFLTYAVWRIRQVIHKAINNHSRTVRLPEHRVQQLGRLQHGLSEVQASLGRAASFDEVAAWLQIEPATAHRLLMAAGPVASLDKPMNDENGVATLADLVPDRRRPSPDELLAARALSADLERALSLLTERQADILRRRYGLHGPRRESLPELSQRYRLTAERIRQIEHEALLLLRKPSRVKYFDHHQYRRGSQGDVPI